MRKIGNYVQSTVTKQSNYKHEMPTIFKHFQIPRPNKWNILTKTARFHIINIAQMRSQGERKVAVPLYIPENTI